MSARDRKRLEQLTESAQTNAKLDEILDLRVDDIDVRLAKVENSMAKLGVRSALVGGLGGLLVSVGFELIKAKLGG